MLSWPRAKSKRLRRAIRAVAAGEDPPRPRPNADGTIVHGRTVEFGIPLDVDLVVVPRGYNFVGATPLGEGKKWTAKYAATGGMIEPSHDEAIGAALHDVGRPAVASPHQVEVGGRPVHQRCVHRDLAGEGVTAEWRPERHDSAIGLGAVTLAMLTRLDLVTIWVTVLLAVGLYAAGKLTKEKAITAGVVSTENPARRKSRATRRASASTPAG